MKKIFAYKNATSAMMCAFMVFLPACDWFKGCTDKMCSSTQQSGDNEVVITFNGKPVITGADYEKSIQMLMQAQPAFQQMWPFMGPDQQEQVLTQIAENLAAERVMQEAVKRSGLDKTSEFKDNARQIHEAVDRDLAMRTFQNELVKNIVIADEEAQQYYEANREKPNFKCPPFVRSGAGVRAEVILASSLKEAQDIAAQAKKNPDFAAVAKSANKTVVDLGVVSQQSMGIDAAVKAKLLLVKKFPTVEVVTGSDKKEYVVKAISKSDEKFADFAQPEVKEAVKQILLGEKFNDIFNKKMNDLKAEYNVVVNKDYIAKRIKASQPQEEVAAQVEVEEIKTAPKAV
ncbi:MAG: hypothetical protein WC707_00390 [Candidatus Babeliaceae bacterium]